VSSSEHSLRRADHQRRLSRNTRIVTPLDRDSFSDTHNGGTLRKITGEREVFAWSEEPNWSSDARWIAFTHAALFGSRRALGEMNCEIWVMDASGKRQAQLTRNRVHDGLPAWSPDARRIAFLRYERSPDDSGLYVMNANGTGVMRLTQSRVAYASPAWQPVASGA
jgi:Tol biopolymer transport system component